jgi:hypothetical protein
MSVVATSAWAHGVAWKGDFQQTMIKTDQMLEDNLEN